MELDEKVLERVLREATPTQLASFTTLMEMYRKALPPTRGGHQAPVEFKILGTDTAEDKMKRVTEQYARSGHVTRPAFVDHPE